VITNEVQYRATRGHLEKFQLAIANLEATMAEKGETKRLAVELDALCSQADDLRTEIAEYDDLRSGTVSSLEAESLADLATLLIKARIARNWTQRQLADALGIAEQQVQRYESTEYRSASLARICDVASALEIAVTERAVLGKPGAAA
jgi:HTH-type transcriptional regulator / antitoxin HigA